VKKILNSILDIRKGEVVLTLLMTANYYLILMTYYFLKPARDSLFLVKISPEMLPLVFIVTALVTAPIVTMYLRASRSLPLNKLIILTVGVIIINLLILRWLIQINQSWVYYLFYTWVSIYGALTTSQFWLLANAVYDSSQAKRLFTLLGLGGILGAFTGGEVTNLFIRVLGISTENLLYFCIAFLIVSALLVTFIWSRARQDAPRTITGRQRHKEAAPARLSQSLKTILQSRHLRLTVGIVALTMMVASFVDFQFKTVSYNAFSEKEELTAFLGTFYGRLSLVSFALQMFFGYRLIRLLGVGGIIMFLPISLIIGSAAMLIYPGLIAGSLLRGADGALKYSLDKTGRELLFLPISLDIKKRSKIFIDMFVDRWFRGLAGALLLLFTMVIGLSIREISIVVLVLLMIWLILTMLMRKEYINSFRLAIAKRRIDAGEIRMHINDENTVNTLILLLGSTNDRQVVYALDMLKSVKNVELIHPVKPLLKHGNYEVRYKALEVLQIHADQSLNDDIKSLLEDGNPEVRREAVYYLCRNAEEGETASLQEYLYQPNRMIQNAALACIAEHGNAEQYGLVDEKFVLSHIDDDMSGSEETRMHLAKILARADNPALNQYLERFLDDSSIPVAREAIAGIGHLKIRKYIPWLLEKLADRRFRRDARTALAQFGDSILGTLTDYLRDFHVDIIIRSNIPSVMAQIPEQQTVEVLMKSLGEINPSLKHYVVKALNKLHVQHTHLKFKREMVGSILFQETKDYYEILQVLQTHKRFEPNDGFALLKKALIERQRQNLEQIFRLLGLVYPSRDIYNAYYGVISRQKTLHANSVEFLDNLLHTDIKKYILPILDDVVPEVTFQKAEDLFGVSRKTREEALVYLINSNDIWLRTCAIYCSIGIESDNLEKRVRDAKNDPDPVVRETAELVLSRKRS
jgi:ATP/ADP translocase